MQLPLSPLHVQPAAKLSLCPRDTHRHTCARTGHGHSQSQRLPQTRRCRHQHPHTGPTSHTSTSSLWGWQRQDITSAGTHITLSGFTSTCTPVGPPSTSIAPLSPWYLCVGPNPLTHPTGPRLTGWSSSLLAANTQHSHTHPTGTPHWQVPLGTSMDPQFA